MVAYPLYVHRFIAVTRPIQYAKHRNSCRVYVTLALTWIVSIAVSLPIPLGINYTPQRARTPWLCILYNSDFIIFSSMTSLVTWSSMTSFYVPCVLMIFLYWRTFRAISARANKMAASARRRKSIEVTMTAGGSPRARAVEVAGDDEGEQQRPAAATVVVHAVVNGSSGVDAATTPMLGDQKDPTTKYPDYQTLRSGGDDNEHPTTATSDVDGGNGEGSAEEGAGTTTSAVAGGGNTELTVRRPSHRQRRRRRLMVVQPVHDSPSPARRSLFRSGRQRPSSADSRQRSGKTTGSGLRMRRSAIFAFGLQRIVQKPEKLSTKRERKATQTLAIVLG